MVDRTQLPAFVIVSAKDIAKRAHEIFVDRGCADGFDREDWLRAEHELKNPAGCRVSVFTRCNEPMPIKRVEPDNLSRRC